MGRELQLEGWKEIKKRAMKGQTAQMLLDKALRNHIILRVL